MRESVVRSMSWSPGPGCHGGCGVKFFVEDGRLVKVEGDEDHPYSHGRVCARMLALTQFVYPYHYTEFEFESPYLVVMMAARNLLLVAAAVLAMVPRRYNDNTGIKN